MEVSVALAPMPYQIWTWIFTVPEQEKKIAVIQDHKMSHHFYNFYP